MSLIDWIKSAGVEARAEQLGITPRTVTSWLYLEGAPQFDNAYKIKVLSRGKLGFNEIYGPYFDKVHRLNKQKS